MKNSLKKAYYDSWNRDGRTQVETGLELDVNTQTAATPKVVDKYYAASYLISSFSTAPSWAVCWQWLWGGSTIPYYFSIPITTTDISLGLDDNDITFDGNTVIINYTQALARISSSSNFNNLITLIGEICPSDSITLILSSSIFACIISVG